MNKVAGTNTSPIGVSQGQGSIGNPDQSDQIRKLVEQLMKLVPMLEQALKGQDQCSDGQCGNGGGTPPTASQGGSPGIGDQFGMLEELLRKLGKFDNRSIQDAVAGIPGAQQAIMTGANLNSAGTVAGMPAGFA